MVKRIAFIFLVLTLLFTSLFLIFEGATLEFKNLIDRATRLAIPQMNNDTLYDPPSYVFPKKALESDTPLPDKVNNSVKSTVNITAQFALNSSDTIYSLELSETSGTGFMIRPGIFLSARHIFLITMLEFHDRGLSFSINDAGLPTSSSYSYRFFATTEMNDEPVTFPLELVAMGDPYKSQDFAAFKAVGWPRKLKALEFEENIELGVELEKTIVYSNGRVPSFDPLGGSLSPPTKKVLMDFINYTITGSVSAILTDMPHNKEAGLKKLYRIKRLKNNVEPGYSGGPVFDKNGKVVGMTISVSGGRNFSYAISATDLKIFVEGLEAKGIIPKK